MSTDMPGGYSEWSFQLTPEARNAFDAALKGIMGVNYEPFAFAQQVVAGMNYSFLAKARPVVPNPRLGVAKIQVFAPLPGEGPPKLGNIEEILP